MDFEIIFSAHSEMMPVPNFALQMKIRYHKHGRKEKVLQFYPGLEDKQALQSNSSPVEYNSADIHSFYDVFTNLFFVEVTTNSSSVPQGPC